MEELRAHQRCACALPAYVRLNILRRTIVKFQKLTPSLIVSNVEASLRFYCDVLAFQRAITVPDVPPYAFGSVTNGDLEIFFTEKKAAEEDYPQLATREIGGTLTLFIEVEGLDELMATVKKSGARTHHAAQDPVLRNARIRF